MKKLLVIIAAAALFVACGNQIPTTYQESGELPHIYPDYTNVTVPINIAPLTFEADEKCDGIVARLAVGDEEVICGGTKVQPDADDWRLLAEHAKGKAITVDVYINHDGQWTRFKPFSIYVSPDSIDPYISYRLIAPSYVTYEDLTISQRSLEDYDESVIYGNMLCTEGAKGQCINCHNYQQYNPDRMQFHARENLGGTIIAYDVERNEVTNIENDPNEFEVFPYWAPDGKTLYYCSAHFERQDTIDPGLEVLQRFKEVKYNIYKKSFNPETRQFGPRELVFDAATLGKSATLPRISPDGRFLMFTMGDYGVFHIWHGDADLWMIDLKEANDEPSATAHPLKEVNSKSTESYHSWSSNGRWVVFSSRRYDGNYTRPFFAHIDKDGKASKPFELPCADPDYHRQFLRSYNIPEFMHGPVTISPQNFADALMLDGEPVKYVQQLSK